MRAISAKKRAQMKEDHLVKEAIRTKIGGRWVVTSEGSKVEGPCKKCLEWKVLDPAHIISRARGGKFTEENIEMLCRECHSKGHGINVVQSEPQWSKGV